MKLLIAMTMMVFTSTSVFAACEARTPGDCKAPVDCEKLNSGEKVVEWRIIPPQSSGQCVSIKTEDPNTDCSSIKQNKRDNKQQPAISPQQQGKDQSV